MISGAVKADYSWWETHWESSRNTLLLGEPNGAQHSSSNTITRAQTLADLFEGGAVRVKANVCQPEDEQQIKDRIFDKLLINCAINPLGALGGVDCGETVDWSETLIRRLVGEATTVAAQLHPPIRLSLNADKILTHYRAQYGLKSSMLHDLEHRRPTEKSAIVDSLVELGALHGVDTPCLETISCLLETIEKRNAAAAAIAPE
jgi:ketopantoate reductase